MISEKKTYKVEEVIDFSSILKNDDEIVSISVDKDGINSLIIHLAPEYRTENGMFAIIKTEKPKNYTFFRHDFNGNLIFKTIIKNEYFNFHNVNILPNDEILLICGRSRYVSETEIDKNARVYNIEGEFLRDFIVGDGIENVKIDNNGDIWTSYFDEGIFGNYGWNNPIGSSGLVCWDKKGNKKWEFEPIEGLNYMADCYAMNIDSENNVWFYYYTEFPIVKLNGEKKIEFWNTTIHGANSLNIFKNKILMADGYSGDVFVLLELKGKSIKKLNEIEFISVEGDELNNRNYISSSGSNIGFRSNNKIYLINMNEIV